MTNYWSDSWLWISLSFGLIDFYIIKQLQSYPVIMPTVNILNIKDNVLSTQTIICDNEPLLKC